MGPAILITLGVLFLLAQLPGDALGFHNTWPILLVVIGAVSLGSATASSEGHIESVVTQGPAAMPAPPPPANPPNEQGQ